MIFICVNAIATKTGLRTAQEPRSKMNEQVRTKRESPPAETRGRAVFNYYVRLTRLPTQGDRQSSCTALQPVLPQQRANCTSTFLPNVFRTVLTIDNTDDMHTPFHHGAWLCSPSGLPPARYPLGRAHLPLEAQVRLQIERAECRQARSRTTERCGGRVTLAVRTL